MKAAEEPVDFSRIPFVLEVWIVQRDMGFSNIVYLLVALKKNILSCRNILGMSTISHAGSHPIHHWLRILKSLLGMSGFK